jgi:hypothetical protein
MSGMSTELAESWVARWEATADAEGRKRGSAYWDDAWAWIESERR